MYCRSFALNFFFFFFTGVRNSPDSREARGGEAAWHTRQRADDFYGDFDAK